MIPESYTAQLAGRRAEGPPDIAQTGDDWLRRLPRLLDELIADGELTVTGPARHGVAALVLPVLAPAGPAVLKVIWPHPEAATEHLALRRWGGVGAVRLLSADPSRWAMLLEAADPDTSLQDLPIVDACEQIGLLLRILAVPALPRLPSLRDTAARYADEMAGLRAIPRRMVEQAVALCSDLADDDCAATVAHTDLHFENVLRSLRPGTGTGTAVGPPPAAQPWLAIDPQAQNAEPAFGVAPVLWNRWDEALAATSVRTHLRLRVEVVCDAAGIDVDRARAWSVVREVMNAVWAVADGEPDRVTRAVTIIKAMQD